MGDTPQSPCRPFNDDSHEPTKSALASPIIVEWPLHRSARHSILKVRSFIAAYEVLSFVTMTVTYRKLTMDPTLYCLTTAIGWSNDQLVCS